MTCCNKASNLHTRLNANKAQRVSYLEVEGHRQDGGRIGLWPWGVQVHLISIIIIPSHTQYHYSYSHIIFILSQLTLTHSIPQEGQGASHNLIGRVHRISYIVTSTGHQLFSWWGGQAASLKQIRGTLISFYLYCRSSLSTQAYTVGDEGVIYHYHTIPHHLSYHLHSTLHIIFRSRVSSITPYPPSYHYHIHIALIDHISSHHPYYM